MAAGGASIQNLSQPLLARCSVPYPSLAVQAKIAEVLTAYDDLMEANFQRIKLLEKMAQVTFEEWFVRLRFPGHETTQFDPETCLPEGWKKATVGSLLSKVRATTKIPASQFQLTGSIPVIDQSREFVAGFTDNKEALLDLGPTIVFGDHTRVLKLIKFPFARGADGTQIIISNTKRMPQHLFYLRLKNIDLSDYHYARHFKFLKDFEVKIPSYELAERFDSFAENIYKLILKLREQSSLLKEARDLLLPRLMTGSVDVYDYLAQMAEKQVALENAA